MQTVCTRLSSPPLGVRLQMDTDFTLMTQACSHDIIARIMSVSDAVEKLRKYPKKTTCNWALEAYPRIAVVRSALTETN